MPKLNQIQNSSTNFIFKVSQTIFFYVFAKYWLQVALSSQFTIECNALNFAWMNNAVCNE